MLANKATMEWQAIYDPSWSVPQLPSLWSTQHSVLPRGGYFPTFAVWSRIKKLDFRFPHFSSKIYFLDDFVTINPHTENTINQWKSIENNCINIYLRGFFHFFPTNKNFQSPNLLGSIIIYWGLTPFPWSPRQELFNHMFGQ